MTISEGKPDFSPTAQLVEEYFLFKPHLTEGSKHFMRTVLRLFHNFVGNKDWKSVTAKDLMQFLSQYQRQRSRFSRFHIIRGLLRWLYEDELPKDLAKLKLPEPKEVVVTTEDLLTNDEVADLRDACQTLRDKVIIMMLWGTGMRVHELLGLKVSDIKDRNGITRLRVHKGKTGPHDYFIANDALPWLKQWMAHIPLNPTAYLFTSPYKEDKHLSRHAIMKALRKAARKAGIKKRVYPHLFRHIRNTHLVRTIGRDKAKLVQGYRSNCIDVYTHLCEQDIEAAFMQSEGLEVEYTPEPSRLTAVPMTCPRCGFSNVAESLYCGRCTQPLCSATQDGLSTLDIQWFDPIDAD